MRALFTFVGGRGHFEPLAPIARAAVAAGHEVAFASGGLLPVIEAAGFTAFFVAPERPPPPRRPLRGVDMENELRILRDVLFSRVARERVPSVVELCGRWRPDVVVCDEADLGSSAGVLAVPALAARPGYAAAAGRGLAAGLARAGP